MDSENTFAMSAAKGFLYLTVSEGLDLQKTLAAAEISMQEFQDNDAMLSQKQAKIIAQAIEAGVSKAAFFRSLLRANHGDFGVQGYALRHSKTLGEALQLRARYNNLTNQITDCYLDISKEEVRLSLSYQSGLDESLVRMISESWAILGLLGLRRITAPGWAALCVGFPYPKPVYAPDLEEILQCPLRFSTAASFISFAPKDLEQSIMGADQALQSVVVAYCESMLSKLTPRTVFSERVRRILVPMLQRGIPSVDEIAKQLGVSPRTLQRRLGDERTSFRELIEKTQEELAQLYLKQRYVTLSEISFLLGFSTHASFHKAFRRWTNETPGDFRRRHLELSASP
jgi:AraC-like DNA-binding protein